MPAADASSTVAGLAGVTLRRPDNADAPASGSDASGDGSTSETLLKPLGLRRDSIRCPMGGAANIRPKMPLLPLLDPDTD